MELNEELIASYYLLVETQNFASLLSLKCIVLR